jgi:hypothetical protein
MLTLQEISDRLEIHDLIHRYSQLIDTKNFDALRDEIFTEDAFIDYGAFGGSVGTLDETIEFLHQAFKIFPNSQHLNANLQIVIDGDRATGRVMCLNPQEMEVEGKENHIFFCGLWYVDEYRMRSLSSGPIAQRTRSLAAPRSRKY